MIDRNHPAVEAGAERFRTEMMGPSWTRPWEDLGERAKRNWRIRALGVLEHGLPHLTADDLRDTPAGKQLLAEGWDERHKARPDYSQGHDDDCMGWEDCHCGRYVNPYRT